MLVDRQIEAGLLVSPVTEEPLRLDPATGTLVTLDGSRRYPMHEGRVPILLPAGDAYRDSVRSSERISREYSGEHLEKMRTRPWRVKAALTRDYRSEASRRAFEEVFSHVGKESVCLSVGGGPQRVHASLTNLNIAPFPGVDIVGDAHRLPYRSGSVDVIHCDAVLEHLADPAQAVREMLRVLKAGGRAYVSTPFLQAYHGYPHHYQNFTLTGHTTLFREQGFTVEEAGTCVGPTWVMVSLASTYIHHYFPRPWNVLLGKAWGLFGAALRPLDRRLVRHKDAHVMASTTYLVARKPRE